MTPDSGKIPYLPEPIAGLERIALNLWWRWDRRARLLLRNIDPTLWSATRHNPVAMLRQVDPNRLAQLSRAKKYLPNTRPGGRGPAGGLVRKPGGIRGHNPV